MSKTISYTEARNHLKTYLDYVLENHKPVIIKRRDGKNIVLLAEEDYEAIDETAYLLSTEANRRELLESVASINRGDWKKLKKYNSLNELLEEMEETERK